MEKIIKFVNENLPYFLLTSSNKQAEGRPFGAIMSDGTNLYISTSNKKKVYHELKANSLVQIISFKYGTRDWLRISANAIEIFDFETKDKMLKECPVLYKHYANANVEFYAVFKLELNKVEWF